MTQSNGPTSGVPLQRINSLPVRSRTQPVDTFFGVPMDTQSSSAPGTMMLFSRTSNSNSASSSNTSSRSSSTRSIASTTDKSADAKPSGNPLKEEIWFDLPPLEPTRPKTNPLAVLILNCQVEPLRLLKQLYPDSPTSTEISSASAKSSLALSSSQEKSTSSAQPITRRFSLTKNTSKWEILQTLITNIKATMAEMMVNEYSDEMLAIKLKEIFEEALAKIKSRHEINAEKTNKIKTMIEGFIQEFEKYITPTSVKRPSPSVT